MKITLIQCEECDATTKLIDRGRDGWIILARQFVEEQHFCSEHCLKKHLGVGEPTQPLEQPVTKMRRFRLFTEGGDEKQGVVCENGHVLIDEHEQSKETHYHDWDTCKIAYDGGGAQWVDPEVVV